MSQENVEILRRQVIVRIHQTATGTQSGAPIEGDFWFLYTFRDRKVVRLEMYIREAQALEAAGLRE